DGEKDAVLPAVRPCGGRRDAALVHGLGDVGLAVAQGGELEDLPHHPRLLLHDEDSEVTLDLLAFALLDARGLRTVAVGLLAGGEELAGAGFKTAHGALGMGVVA